MLLHVTLVDQDSGDGREIVIYLASGKALARFPVGEYRSSEAYRMQDIADNLRAIRDRGCAYPLKRS